MFDHEYRRRSQTGYSDVEKEFTQIASVLGNLGLSNYEARAYVALILRTHATAEDIAELAVIPRTSAYKSLQSLVTKGFAQVRKAARPSIIRWTSRSFARGP